MADEVTARDPLRERLREAAEGLVYSSESDFPFEPFSLPLDAARERLTPAAFASLVGAPPGTPASETTLERFLQHHIEASDPWDTRAQELRPRYERLRALLRDNLREARVFRIGEIRIRCYLVGFDARGDLVGLVTTAVET
jgi:hypothetical protein